MTRGELLTDLDQKARKRERILPHQHPPPVPNQLTGAPPEHRKQKGPRPVLDPQPQMDDQCDGEKRDEHAVCG